MATFTDFLSNGMLLAMHPLNLRTLHPLSKVSLNCPFELSAKVTSQSTSALGLFPERLNEGSETVVFTVVNVESEDHVPLVQSQLSKPVPRWSITLVSSMMICAAAMAA